MTDRNEYEGVMEDKLVQKRTRARECSESSLALPQLQSRPLPQVTLPPMRLTQADVMGLAHATSKP